MTAAQHEISIRTNSESLTLRCPFCGKNWSGGDKTHCPSCGLGFAEAGNEELTHYNQVRAHIEVVNGSSVPEVIGLVAEPSTLDVSAVLPLIADAPIDSVIGALTSHQNALSDTSLTDLDTSTTAMIARDVLFRQELRTRFLEGVIHLLTIGKFFLIGEKIIIPISLASTNLHHAYALIAIDISGREVQLSLRTTGSLPRDIEQLPDLLKKTEPVMRLKHNNIDVGVTSSDFDLDNFAHQPVADIVMGLRSQQQQLSAEAANQISQLAAEIKSGEIRSVLKASNQQLPLELRDGIKVEPAVCPNCGASSVVHAVGKITCQTCSHRYIYSPQVDAKQFVRPLEFNNIVVSYADLLLVLRKRHPTQQLHQRLQELIKENDKPDTEQLVSLVLDVFKVAPEYAARFSYREHPDGRLITSGFIFCIEFPTKGHIVSDIPEYLHGKMAMISLVKTAQGGGWDTTQLITEIIDPVIFASENDRPWSMADQLLYVASKGEEEAEDRANADLTGLDGDDLEHWLGRGRWTTIFDEGTGKPYVHSSVPMVRNEYHGKAVAAQLYVLRNLVTRHVEGELSDLAPLFEQKIQSILADLDQRIDAGLQNGELVNEEFVESVKSTLSQLSRSEWYFSKVLEKYALDKKAEALRQIYLRFLAMEKKLRDVMGVGEQEIAVSSSSGAEEPSGLSLRRLRRFLQRRRAKDDEPLASAQSESLSDDPSTVVYRSIVEERSKYSTRLITSLLVDHAFNQESVLGRILKAQMLTQQYTITVFDEYPKSHEEVMNLSQFLDYLCRAGGEVQPIDYHFESRSKTLASNFFFFDDENNSQISKDLLSLCSHEVFMQEETT